MRAERLSWCRVDAGGVPAEGAEATIARPDQLTFVWFRSDLDPSVAVEANRAAAGELAAATGARVFTVGCRGWSGPPSPTAVEDGVTAYVWLLSEGSDSALTAFVADRETDSLAKAVLRSARERGDSRTRAAESLRLTDAHGASLDRMFGALRRADVVGRTCPLHRSWRGARPAPRVFYARPGGLAPAALKLYWARTEPRR